MGELVFIVSPGAGEQWGIDPAGGGLEALPKLHLYASHQIHHLVHRTAAVLGLGRRALAQLPTDDSFRLNVRALGQ